MRGQKTCKPCGHKTGPRSKKCPKCGERFLFAPKIHKTDKAKRAAINWRELVKGDVIKTRGGPYWITGDGRRIPMGYSGTFYVQKVTENGIEAYGTKKETGFCYIYMGERTVVGNMRRRPHKILKLRVRERE